MKDKPLGGKSYGSIPHLSQSRLGVSDSHVHAGQELILTKKARDKHDEIFVFEKVDGTNVSVANIDGAVIPLIRAGYTAFESKHLHHRMFADWVFTNPSLFKGLKEGQRLCGEWLAMTHGIRYAIDNPIQGFVCFDLIYKNTRLPIEQLFAYTEPRGITTAKLLHRGSPIAVEKADKLLGDHGSHGAKDRAEGVVYRVERKGEFDFMAKNVRSDFVAGRYFDQDLWNFRIHYKR